MCQTKFVDLFQENNLAFLRFFSISHIMVEKLNFRFSTVFFGIKKENIHFIRKCVRQNFDFQQYFLKLKWKIYIWSESVSDKICRTYWRKPFFILTFFVFHILWLKNWIFDFQQHLFKLKWKIYIWSESVSDKICRPYWKKQLCILT